MYWTLVEGETQQNKRNKSYILCDHLCLVLSFLNINQVCPSSTLTRRNLQHFVILLDFRAIPEAKRIFFILQVHNLFVHQKTYPLILIFLDRFLFLLSSGPLSSLEVVEGFREVCLQSLALELPLPGGQEDYHQFLLINFILMIISEPSFLIISRFP